MDNRTRAMALLALFVMATSFATAQSTTLNDSITLIVNILPLLILLITGFVGLIAAFVGIIVIVITIRFMKQIMELPIDMLKGVMKK